MNNSIIPADMPDGGSEIRIFTVNGYPVRGLKVDGKAAVVGADFAAAMGYANPRTALARHCKGVLKRDIPTTSGIQEMTVIFQGDINRLICHSKLPAAGEFEKEVMEVILPAIQQTGSYSLVAPKQYTITESLEIALEQARRAERAEALSAQQGRQLVEAEQFKTGVHGLLNQMGVQTQTLQNKVEADAPKVADWEEVIMNSKARCLSEAIKCAHVLINVTKLRIWLLADNRIQWRDEEYFPMASQFLNEYFVSVNREGVNSHTNDDYESHTLRATPHGIVFIRKFALALGCSPVQSLLDNPPFYPVTEVEDRAGLLATASPHDRTWSICTKSPHQSWVPFSTTEQRVGMPGLKRSIRECKGNRQPGELCAVVNSGLVLLI